MLPLKLICERKNIRKDGTSVVFIQYCYSAENRTILNTEIAVPPAFWNKKTGSISKDLPAGYGDYKELNEELKRLYRLAEDIVEFAIKKNLPDRGKFVKETFSPRFDLMTLTAETEAAKLVALNSCALNRDLFHQLDDYIQSKEKNVAPSTVGIFRQMKEHLFAFQTFRKEPIKFESLDYGFYEAFKDYLTFEHVQVRRKEVIKGLKVNTVGKTVKQLRTFVKDRIRRKIIAPIDLTEFQICEEEADAVYLSETEIQQILDADLSGSPHLAKYRDLFVFGCLTGLRFSDFSQIKASDVRDRKLFKKQEKSESWVVIPLKQVAFQIFTGRFKQQIPRISNPDLNYYIKEVGRMAGIDTSISFSHKRGGKTIAVTKPKYEWITSHTCRRSFCTNEFLAGTPVQLIMKISGHKKEKSFYRYIRISAEEAANKIEEIWRERENSVIIGKNSSRKRQSSHQQSPNCS
ncbi:site-specific integrase [Flavisolibacter ginsenosidimutans]|uniref:Tyrosine-type recombinase/integrase n=1 Tax=Flavisolibacter ginsenosidimutans TaxID=661481 RepID=A0A5B8UNX5_9BACT|nr:site-specific integrase [Flavisolibacter ginsenosidimutans]QEC58381.1 tyrosine-type recombinase/integrase [Flavisolibacter ginsenosidimutans]